ncbi:imidazole glycerol phosphate synthase subunit [Escherichia coli]|uniref:Imidazole glycerol phosphate synthase subunit n=1 Tax=Escherichia coli TaxID=562 RepID=A0A376U8B8_ECOLX|nr:imidazole glycerol phosphate synthase subunit [Escherichia coli]
MNVVILDTGCANLNSVKSAIARHGYEPKVSRDPTSCCWPINYFYPALAPRKQRWIRCVSASCLISSKPVPNRCWASA